MVRVKGVMNEIYENNGKLKISQGESSLDGFDGSSNLGLDRLSPPLISSFHLLPPPSSPPLSIRDRAPKDRSAQSGGRERGAAGTACPNALAQKEGTTYAATETKRHERLCLLSKTGVVVGFQCPRPPFLKLGPGAHLKCLSNF